MIFESHRLIIWIWGGGIALWLIIYSFHLRHKRSKRFHYVTRQDDCMTWPRSRDDCYSVKIGVDTQFCTNNLILKMTKVTIHIPKIWNCITCINSFIAYHKNDLETLTVAMICPILKSNCRIERYHEIKLSRSACILFRWNWSRMINLI